MLFSWVRNRIWCDETPLALNLWLTNGLAAIMLVFILTINVFFWPIPLLGFTIDPPTATIVQVERGTSAATAGLRTGDRILTVYNRSLDDVFSHINMLFLAGPRERPVSVTIERHGVVYSFLLVQDPPSADFQLTKATNIVVALLCWLTGYILGIVRRHQTTGSGLVAVFWLILSGVIGSYFFAWIGSYPLRAVLQWLMLAVLVPLGIYIHVWFPVRPVPPNQARFARRALVVSCILLNSIFVVAIGIWQPSLIRLIRGLSDALSLGALVVLIGIGTILWRAYRRTSIAHVRRQIRLIALSCFFVAIAWLLLLVVPLLFGRGALIPDPWVNMLFGIVPLAYLIGGIVPDLYRVDRVLLRLGAHLATATILVLLLAAVMAVGVLQGPATVLWAAVGFVVFYRPVQHLLLRLVPVYRSQAHSYRALHAAATRLTTTLETPILIDAVCEGVRSTFGQPALAFYLGDAEGSNKLLLKIQERMPQLPLTITSGALTDQLCHLPTVAESKALSAALAQTELETTEELAFFHRGVVLWCPIRHADGYLLGVLLLGLRGDLDLYRPEDIGELHRLMEAAALAFANSATYTINSRLHQRVLQERDETAAEIARELHDETININVRSNIHALQRLLQQVTEPALRDELELMLASAYALAQDLRMICEQLHPTGLDDPFGLASVLLMQVEKAQASCTGVCRLVVEGTPCPIAARMQREALGITTEALTNAIKHADATEIMVRLRYPSTLNSRVEVTIQDNGRTNQVVAVKPGHWGIRGMQERAARVGGAIHFCRELAGGTAVIFTFPPLGRESTTSTPTGES